jgi:cob(I)alamin adenosyltransferase
MHEHRHEQKIDLWRKSVSGLIIIFTGDGKGKTTAAFGLALRAAGQGLNVLIIQFMKGQNNIGEINALMNFRLPIEIKRFGREGFVQSRACESLDIHLAEQGMTFFRQALSGSEHDLIILDEILVAIDFGLLKEKALREVLLGRPPHLHIVLTGRNATPRILDLADLVTDMQDLKHPYNAGVKAQAGIEY